MSKKTILIIVVALILLLGVGGGYYYINSSKIGGTKTTGITNPLDLLKNKEEVSGDLTYEDTSGFLFKYPKGVKVEDITPEGDTYYAQLTVSKGNEKITISILDASYKTIDEWAKGADAPDGLTLSGATTLGGLSSKQYTTGSKLYTVTVDQGVLYLIEGPKDGGYWEDVQALVIETFAFAGSSTAGGSGGSDNAIYEEEEIIE